MLQVFLQLDRCYSTRKAYLISETYCLVPLVHGELTVDTCNINSTNSTYSIRQLIVRKEFLKEKSPIL